MSRWFGMGTAFVVVVIAVALAFFWQLNLSNSDFSRPAQSSIKSTLHDGIKAAEKKLPTQKRASSSRLKGEGVTSTPEVTDHFGTTSKVIARDDDVPSAPFGTCDAGRLLLVKSIDNWRTVNALIEQRRPLDTTTVEALRQLMIAARDGKQQVVALSDLQITTAWNNATGAAVYNDEYCDCNDGRDEPDTGVCDRTLRREFLSHAARQPRLCSAYALSATPRLYGSRHNDGYPDCCDCSDEGASASASPSKCPRRCDVEAARAVATLQVARKEIEAGIEECHRRAVYGVAHFANAFKGLLADREAWLTEAKTFVKAQVDLFIAHQQKSTAPPSPPTAADTNEPPMMMPEAELRNLAQFVMNEDAKQRAMSLLSAPTYALGTSFQYHPFAPQLPILGASGNESDPREIARKQRFAAAVKRRTTCLSLTRHETQFRGGSADPDSYNFTFVVCPFEQVSMVKVNPIRDAADSDSSEKLLPQESKPSSTVLGRFGVSGTRIALPSFDAFFATAIGGVPRPQTEDRSLYFAMQSINKRPNALNATHVKANVSRALMGGSPLHPFDYELVTGASVRNDTLWLSGGDDCWGGPHRHVRIAFICGDADALVDVRENGKCAYEAVIATPSACCTGPSPGRDVSVEARRKIRSIDAELRRLMGPET